MAEDHRWEFEVDGQKFDVLDVEDPRVEVRPYQQEYDAYNSFLAASEPLRPVTAALRQEN